MFTHIVSQISGRITALYTQALVSLKALRCKLVSNLRVKFIQVFLSAVSRLRLHLRQLVSIVLLQKKEQLVEKTKLARSRIKESKTVQTPMAPQSTQGGLKSQGRAKRPRQPAKRASKKGK
jgi:hypothetical protein